MQILTQDALLVASRQELIHQILALQERLQAKSSKVEELEFQLDYLKRQIFGTKSERFVPPSDLQMMLDLGIEPSTRPTGRTEKISYERRRDDAGDSKAGHGRGAMPTHLLVVEKTILPEGDVSGLKLIGEEVSWHYEMKPSSLYVVKVTRPKYGLPKGEGVLCGELPPLPINKGNAGPGLMTQVTVDKYVYHIPLDRQRKRFKSEYAVDFSLSWLSDLVKNTGFWIEPVHQGYVRALLQADYLCADETPIPVLCRDVRGKTHRGYFWVYYDPLRKIVVFDYRKSRSAQGPLDFLGGYGGTLQVDGYDGYNEVIARNGIRRAGCMDHVRRRFERAKDYDRERAVFALDTMKVWYEVEDEARKKGSSGEERFEKRRELTLPSMAAFKEWLDANLPVVLPKSPIAAAIGYALGQWPYFEPFMTDPRVELSNILTENKIRPVAIGRKNYMFKGSHDAARRAAMIYSLVETAKAHHIDPFVYIKALLTGLPAAKNTEIDQFLIPVWKPIAAEA
jgi:transposase